MLPYPPRSLIGGSADCKRFWPPDSAGKEERGSRPQAGMQTRCPDPMRAHAHTRTHTHLCLWGRKQGSVGLVESCLAFKLPSPLQTRSFKYFKYLNKALVPGCISPQKRICLLDTSNITSHMLHFFLVLLISMCFLCLCHVLSTRLSPALCFIAVLFGG